jgi:hypothetical protein
LPPQAEQRRRQAHEGQAGLGATDGIAGMNTKSTILEVLIATFGSCCSPSPSVSSTRSEIAAERGEPVVDTLAVCVARLFEEKGFHARRLLRAPAKA